MTDAFTQIVAREVATLLTQNSQLLGTVSVENNHTDLQLSPQQVLEVMQGNSQWLNQFEVQLENSFRQIADKALDYWLRNTDKEIRESLKALAKIAELILEDAQGTSLASQINNRQLGNSLSNLTDTIAKELFSRERTIIDESDRSRETSKRYKASRGQTQAKLSKELGRGKRYN